MDDDIFSDPKTTQDPKEDSNMDWKKNGIDKHERLTLKVNVKEANMYNANKKRENKPRVKARTPLDVPKGFKKISKKIRDSYDDEEEEDGEYILVPVFMDKEVSSLEQALTPQERKQLDQMERPQAEDINIRQSVNRDIQLQQAEKTLKKAGLEADRGITEQKRNDVRDVKAKDLADDNLKKRKKQKDKKTPASKEEKPIKPAKELPKIKDAETKEVRKAIIDDAEKEKKSIKKNLEKQQQEKDEINAVTKKTKDKQKSPEPEELENNQPKEKVVKPIEKQQEQPLPEVRENKPEEKGKEVQKPAEPKEKLDEETARQIILEKSGRSSSKNLDETIERQAQEIERIEQEIKAEEIKQRQNQILIQRNNRGR